jgi:hypothetical protein
MRKTIATLTAVVCLVLAPSASASFGVSPAAGALPDSNAFWAGVCDLGSPAGAVGTPPVAPRDCLESVPGPSLFTTSALPFPWVAPPSWRLVPVTQAGSHPDATAFAAFNTVQSGAEYAPDGTFRDALVDLPAGVLGEPGGTTQCTQEQFREKPVLCPPSSQVGVITLAHTQEFAPQPQGMYPVYNLEPRMGYTAEFGVSDVGVKTSFRIWAKARTNGDFGVRSGIESAPTGYSVFIQEITLWAVPWASSHDQYRPNHGLTGAFSPSFPLSPSEQAHYDPSWGPIRPFFSTQTACDGANPITKLHTDSYNAPGAYADPDKPYYNKDPDLSDPNWLTYESTSPPVTGCEQITFNPDITLDPTGQGGAAVQATDSPSGLDVELSVPQNNELPFNPPPNGAPQPEVDQYIADATAYWKSNAGFATSHLKDTVVTLPEGMTLNPAAADGQGACSMKEIGVTDTNSPVPPAIRFNNNPVGCPDSSKVGEVEIETPLLAEADWPTGSVYLAAQGDNPFHSDFAIYIVVANAERDLLVKLAGKVTPDPVTGRLTTSFVQNPQLPFDKFKLSFKAGPRAPLATPTTCGSHASVTNLTPYSNPTGPVAVNDPLEITSSPAGGCPTTSAQRPLSPGFSAGSTEVVAGAHSPFTVRVTRPDGNQELDRIEVTTPEGLAAKLAGVPYCPEAAIARAISRTASGDGAKEKVDPSCPASSQVGTTTIGAGAGRTPLYVGGKVYLAGPYKGAPVSMAFIVPAVAGPFDLGVQVVRTGLQINPKTAQVTAVSDTIPKLLRGIPLRIRDVRVDIDRPGFTINPTDCAEQKVTGVVFGASGAATPVSNRFQVAECARLGFKPSLNLRLFGGTKRGDYQRLKAVVTARPGDANIARAAVTLPHSEFLAQEHINTVCTRVQFAADACPAGAIYGKATAISPLLDAPLTGPVYLRSSDNLLPDLVAALRGPDNQPIEIELSGRTDSKNEGIRNTFDVLPDAPVTKFTLEMMGGRKSLIVNSTSICRGVHKADVRMDGQNGRKHNFTPKVINPACGKAKKGKKGKAQKRMVASRTLANVAGGLF